jgi:type I restriction enzyme S subunit
MSAVPFALPPLTEQRAIARILGSLDDKIELNRRMNRTLEELAAAIFKSWFVDFDPVVARLALSGAEGAEGRQPFGMDAEIAALFPAAFEESEVGPVPAGWRVAPIGELVKVVGGTTPSTGNSAYWEGGTIAWATPKDLAGLADPMLLDTERHVTQAGLQQISSGLLPGGTVLMSSRAPIGYLAIAEIPVAINQGFIALICNLGLPNHYVIHWLRENMETIESRANGTTFLEISKANFRPIPALVPPEPIQRRFTEIVGKLHGMIVANARESRTLAAIRDALLPKLMAGEIRVG